MKANTATIGETGARSARRSLAPRSRHRIAAETKDLLVRAAEATSYRRIDGDLESAPEPLKPVLRLIRANLFRPGFNVDQVRRSLGLRSHDVTTELKRHTGTAIRGYIEDRRIECSSWLLLEPGLGLHEVAAVVGYHRFRTFSNAFCRQQGCRPRAYRDSGGALGRLAMEPPAPSGVPPFVAGFAAASSSARCGRCGSAVDAAPAIRIFERHEPLCEPCARRYAPPELLAIVDSVPPDRRRWASASRSWRDLFSSRRRE